VDQVPVADEPREQVLAEVQPRPAQPSDLLVAGELARNSSSVSAWKCSRSSASVGFSTNSVTRPWSSVSMTPYFSATSSGSRVIAAIVATAPRRACSSYIGPRSKSMTESVGNTSAGCVTSQYSSIRSVESALPVDSASYLTGAYFTSTPNPSPYPIMTLIW
jgi:hypothetical protein